MNRKLIFPEEKMYKTFEAKIIIKFDQTNNKGFNYVKSQTYLHIRLIYSRWYNFGLNDIRILFSFSSKSLM